MTPIFDDEVIMKVDYVRMWTPNTCILISKIPNKQKTTCPNSNIPFARWQPSDGG